MRDMYVDGITEVYLGEDGKIAQIFPRSPQFKEEVVHQGEGLAYIVITTGAIWRRKDNEFSWHKEWRRKWKAVAL